MPATRFRWALLAAVALAWPAFGGDAKPTEPKPSPKPSCRTCGGTCGLEPICVCEPGTKKKSTTTYSMKCEPVCVPAPRLLAGGCGRHPSPSCSGGSCDGACVPATVRTKKSLVKTIREEEVDVITRKIEYLCRHCSGGEPAAVCRSCTGTETIARRHPWWWPWPTLH